MKITFFDINENRDTNEHEELYNLLNTDKDNLQNKLKNLLKQ